MVNIYVLKLEDKSGGYKYYIGKTNNHVGIRFSQHKNDKSCSWTAKYPPIELLETIESNDDLDEDKITKKYMMKYGIDNVRGGSYTKVELDDWMIKSLEHELNGSQDICYKCNIKGHFSRNCTQPNYSQKNKPKVINCTRCDRTGHTEENCYAKTDKNGEELINFVEVYCCSKCGKEFDSEKGALFHENRYCKSNSCFRCGRPGHFADDCYANRHVRGKYLD